MTIEQKFMTMCNIGVDGLPTNEINLDVAISICKEAIKDACDQQKEICLKNVKLEMDCNNSTAMEIYIDRTSILNSPYPEGVEK